MKERIITKNFCCTFLAQFSIALVMYMLMTTITEYVTAFGVSAAIGGMVSGIYVFGGLFSRLGSASLMARYGWKKVAVAFLALHFIACVFYFVSNNITVLLLVRFIHGLGFGAGANAVMVIGMASLPKSRYGEAAGYFMLSTSLGIAVGPFAGGLIYDHFGGTGSFVAASALSLIAAVFMMLVDTKAIEPVLQQPAGEMHAEDSESVAEGSAPAVSEMAASGSAQPAGELPVRNSAQPAGTGKRRETSGAAEAGICNNRATFGGSKAGSRFGGLSRFIEKDSVPVSLCILFLSVGYASLLSFYRLYAEELNMTKEFSAFFLIYALVILFSRPAAGIIQDRFGDDAVCYPCFLFQVIALVLLALRPCMATVILGAAGSALGYGTMNSTLNVIANRNVSNERRSFAVATYWACCDLGVGVSPAVLGLIVSGAGFHVMYLAAAAISFIALPVYRMQSK